MTIVAFIRMLLSSGSLSEDDKLSPRGHFRDALHFLANESTRAMAAERITRNTAYTAKSTLDQAINVQKRSLELSRADKQREDEAILFGRFRGQ